MSPRRLVVVHALLAAIVGGHLVVVVRGGEAWPFSAYTMFARPRTAPTLRGVRFVGLGEDGATIALEARAQLAPLDRSRLRSAVLRRVDAGRRHEIGAIAADVRARYERRRARGSHGGPALCGVRVELQTYRRDARARNAGEPDLVEVLAELACTDVGNRGRGG